MSPHREHFQKRKTVKFVRDQNLSVLFAESNIYAVFKQNRVELKPCLDSVYVNIIIKSYSEI